MAEKTYRQEIKRLLSPAQRLLLEQRIGAVLSLDSHSGAERNYLVRSVYFDTVADRAYTEKEAGISDREKIRIRFYNYQDKLILLERKEKRGRLIHKDSLPITRETADALLCNDYSPLTAYNSPLGNYIYGFAHSEGLHPTVTVDYTRTAYVYPAGDVRITFDSALQAARPDKQIWMPGGCAAVLPEYTILEIKFNQYLPEHIRHLLNSVTSQQEALSKYVLCRSHLLSKQGDYLGGKQ